MVKEEDKRKIDGNDLLVALSKKNLSKAASLSNLIRVAITANLGAQVIRDVIGSERELDSNEESGLKAYETVLSKIYAELDKREQEYRR